MSIDVDALGDRLSRRSFVTKGLGAGGVLVSAALIAGCGSSGGSSSGSAATGGGGKSGAVSYSNQVGVVDDKVLYTLAAYDLALANGYFAKRGLHLSTVTSASGAELIREALTNLHFAITASTDSLVAYASDPSSVRIISGLFNAATLQFIVRPNSGITTVADLKGKKIGVSTPTALSTYFAHLAVKKAGLSVGSDVTLEYIGAPPACYAALQRGLVDCAWSIPPLSTAEIAAGKAKLLFKASTYQPHWFDNCVVADAQFIKANPGVTRAFLAGLGEASQLIRSDPEQAGKQWAALAKQPVGPTVTAFKENRDNFSLSFNSGFISAAAAADQSVGVTKSISNPAGIADGSYLPSGYSYS